MEKEIWKDIPWYAWKYQASDLWNIRSTRHRNKFRMKILKPKISWDWYYDVWLVLEWKIMTKRLHRLIMISFYWFSTLQVNHKDWIKTNNIINNLEYCTWSENSKHRFHILWHRNIIQIKKMYDSRRISVIRKIWDEIKIYESLRKAEKENHIARKYISDCCLWIRESAWWYFWSYSILE